MMLSCIVCNKRFEHIRIKKTCSEKCRRIISSQIMSKTNRKYASERMIKNNSIYKPGAREKLSATLKKIGHQPKYRGGNGRPSPVPVKILFHALEGLGFEIEVAVPTKMGRYSGYPTCYKIDIANKKMKIGIEIDGNTHHSPARRFQDIKKENLLTSLGWTILRFTNPEAEFGTKKCREKIMSTISMLKKQKRIS